ncbi:MAG: DUF1800 domain-containing protein [Phycisphaerales bacterium]
MKTTRRRFVHLMGATGAAAALSGCESATDALAALLSAEPDADFRPPTAAEVDLNSHLINRLTYGPRPGDYQRVKSMGAAAFIQEQLEPESIGDRSCNRKVAHIDSLYEPTGELYEFNERRLLADLTAHKMLRAVYSRRQLHEVMVDFWTDHFNIVSGKGDCKWLKAADDRDVIRRHALGNFRELVKASALSPAMLIYLDGHDNKVVHPGDKPNENYARELMELHTLGVHGGYTQADVMEVARCLSGWTYEHRPFGFRPAHVEFSSERHDDGEKLVLGEVIPSGGGEADLDRVIELVCRHPSTARHLAQKLCRWFIADPPPDAAVVSVAGAFASSAGDIKSTLGTLFETEAFGTTRGNLLKRPWRFVVSALRATDAATDGGAPIVEFLHRMGHAPFQYPTPDGYPIEPEPWLGTLLWRWNFALDMMAKRIEGTAVNENRLHEILPGDDQLAAHFLGRIPTPLERDVLAETEHRVALLLASPAFQRH